MSLLLKITNLDLTGKSLLIREDYNVPMNNGQIADETRIHASLPTLQHVLETKGSRIAIMSHLGRPEKEQFDAQFSLAPVAESLSKHLGMEVPLLTNWIDGIDFGTHRVVLCENVRFLKGEHSNDDDLARRMANLCDIYVNDAFATAHRAQASTHGVAKYSPVACGGPLLVQELKSLSKILREPDRPLLAIVGGAKISGKLELLESLLERVDHLIVGGGIANTFLCAAGYNIGKSLYEPSHVDTAKRIIDTALHKGCHLPLPLDAVCVNAGNITIKPIREVCDEDSIMDIGPQSTQVIAQLIAKTKTVIWNGPLGAFEHEEYATGTQAVAEQLAASNAFTVAGGGDTVAAISRWKLNGTLDYISTGGGAFLEFMEGKTLPAVAILDEAAHAWEAMERARDF